ncbi:hypothetical protein NIASO_01450 [Niabella soli DSM 19437]|uniref:Uncharacterized protein n=2 Tax=Niabella TaxID=379899 RepID=W0F259_9BACT|nr:hypothetical protein NIASO_01450 [Niabella soli DSM 19437]
MEINLIFFSNLDSSNGGVETWLRLFLHEVLRGRQYFHKINIYYYTTPSKQIPLPADDNSNIIRYIPIQLSEKKGLFNNFIKLLKFHSNVAKALKKTHAVSALSLGSYPTGIFLAFFLNLYGIRRNTRHYIWLRTTLSKHIGTHTSRIFSKYIFFFEKKALKDADLVISNGWDTRDNYIREYNVPSVVVPNAINLSTYTNFEDVRQLPANKIKIAYIGRFFEAKGAHNFVSAIKIFNSHYPGLVDRVTFSFVGWGEESIEDFARTTPNCEFVGRIPNYKMHTYLATIHCGVALTKSGDDTGGGGSGVSNNLLELMAAGRLILAFDNIIFRQFPRQDFMIYVKENDDNELARYFSQIVDNFQQYYPMADNARSYAMSFSINEHVALLHQYLAEDTN